VHRILVDNTTEGTEEVRDDVTEEVNEAAVATGRLDVSLDDTLMSDPPTDESSNEILLNWAKEQQRKRARIH
jgi:hypothetical protein